MEHLAKIIGYAAEGFDERLGSLSDIYLDTKTWEVRYFVIDHGENLERIEHQSLVTLIPPDAVLGANLQRKIFYLQFSRQDLTLSTISLERKVSNGGTQTELENTFGWFEPTNGIRLFRCEMSDELLSQIRSEVDFELLSVCELVGSQVVLEEGKRGTLKDMIISHDDRPWKIDKLIVDQVSQLEPEKLVFVAPDQIQRRGADTEIYHLPRNTDDPYHGGKIK